METAPAPLVAYQRTVSFTEGGYEPPETATGALDEEETDPEDDESPVDEELVDDESEVAVESEVVAVAALAVLPGDDEAETPGIVSALTVPKMPTPATAARAT